MKRFLHIWAEFFIFLAGALLAVAVVFYLSASFINLSWLVLSVQDLWAILRGYIALTTGMSFLGVCAIYLEGNK